MEHKSDTVSGLVAQARASIRLRDGYYLSEELVDLYLVGLLRGAATGLRDADGPYGQDPDRRAQRLAELDRVSAELTEHLERLRPTDSPAAVPASVPYPVVNPAPLPRRPAADTPSDVPAPR